MAISKENLSVDGVIKIAEKGRAAYVDLMGSNSKVDILEATLERIDNLLKWLIEEQNKLCHEMGVKDLKEFKSKFNQAVDDLNLYKLTGSDLKKLYVNDFTVAAGKYNAEDKKIEDLAQKILDEILNTPAFDISKIDELISKFHGVLLDAVVTESGGKIDLRALTRSAIATQTEDGPKIVAEAITPTVKKRLNLLLKLINNGQKFDRKDYLMLDRLDVTKFKGMEDPIEIEINSEWFELTKGMSETTFLNFLEENPKEAKALRKEVNERMTESICSSLGLSSDNAVKKAINAMLKTKIDDNKTMANMFFIGKAPTEVTGLLGEIAAYAALKKAFGPKVKLRWAAQALEGGKQLSIDIVLNEMFGVQVKNTTKDLDKINYAEKAIAKLGITFVDKSAYDVIYQLTDSEALSKAYESSYFNISYTIDHDNEPHVIAGSSPVFDTIASDLVDLREDVKVFLYRFSPEMVYMANNGDVFAQLATLDNSLQQLGGNLVYIVGNQPVFASEMLLRIRKQIDNLIKEIKGEKITDPENALRISGSHSKNIVNYLNDRADKHEPIGLEKQGALVGVGTISFTSSFRF